MELINKIIEVKGLLKDTSNQCKFLKLLHKEVRLTSRKMRIECWLWFWGTLMAWFG